MPSGQTTYNRDSQVAVPGLLADDGFNDIVSLPAFETIPFGRAVKIRSDGRCELPKADTDTIGGISVYQDLRMGSYPQGQPTINAGDMVAVLRRGRVWMEWDGAGSIVVGATALYKDAAGTVATQGMATASAAAANSVASFNGRAVFWSSGIVGSTSNMVQVDCNIP